MLRRRLSRLSIVASALAALAGALTVSTNAHGAGAAIERLASWATQRSDTIVKVASRPRYAAMATLVTELSIGLPDGAPEYTFTRVSDVLSLRDGSVLILDAGEGPRGSVVVRRYDSSGKYIGTIGRKGQGPGEFESPSGMVQLRDGRILIRDGSQRRINVYSPTGESIDTWRLEPGLNIFNAGGHLLVDTADVLYLRDYTRPRVTLADRNVPFGLVRMRSDGKVIDTIQPPSIPEVPRVELRAQTPQGGGRSTGIPYAVTTSWAVSPLGYLVTGRTDRYAIDLRIPRAATSSVTALWREGDPVVSVRRDVPPVQISEAERAAWKAGTEAFLRVVDPKWGWSGPEIPRTKPAFRSIRMGRDGTIWVMASVPSEPYAPVPTSNPTGRTDTNVPFREPTVYDIFEPDGTYIGRLRLPDRTNLSDISRNDAWGVVRNEDDVPTVKRFRIDWQ